jgi:hypothetical protein
MSVPVPACLEVRSISYGIICPSHHTTSLMRRRIASMRCPSADGRRPSVLCCFALCRCQGADAREAPITTDVHRVPRIEIRAGGAAVVFVGVPSRLGARYFDVPDALQHLVDGKPTGRMCFDCAPPPHAVSGLAARRRTPCARRRTPCARAHMASLCARWRWVCQASRRVSRRSWCCATCCNASPCCPAVYSRWATSQQATA